MDLAHVTILLIEDNPADIVLIREMLASVRGTFHLECADTLAKGLERLASGAVDIVLLDLGLPDSGGLDTVRELHAHAPHVPLIVLTGIEDEVLGINAVWAGAEDYLVKGQVGGRLLVRAIRYAIGRHHFEQTRGHELLYDSVTGLYSRQAFLRLAHRELRLAQRTCDTVLLVVLRLGALSDSAAALGVVEADRTLAKVAGILRATVRETDLIGRVDVDEFAIFAPGASDQSAGLFARLHASLSPLVAELSLEIGAVSSSPNDEAAVERLFARARRACGAFPAKPGAVTSI